MSLHHNRHDNLRPGGGWAERLAVLLIASSAGYLAWAVFIPFAFYLWSN